MVTFFIKHEGGDGTTGVGTVTSLASDTNSGAASAILILGPRNSTSGHRHDEVSGSSVEVEITEVVDGGTTSQWCSLYPFPVLGSAILPPSRVPEWNPRTPYVVRTYSSFVSDRFPPRFRTYLSVLYITLFHLLHFRSPVD